MDETQAAAVDATRGSAPLGSAAQLDTPDERVIEIGWQALLLPVLAVAVVVAGWYLGRMIGGNRVVETLPSPSPVVAVPTSQVVVIGPDGRPMPLTGSSGITDAGVDPYAQPDLDNDPTIFPLREVSHPLLDKPVPDFTLTQLDSGEDVSLSSHAGKTVLVNFWATWCPPCRREMPWLQKAHDNYKDQGLVLLAVDGGEKVPPSMAEETIQRYVTQSGLTFPILWGDAAYQLQNDWSVYGLPATFLIDTEGVVRLVHTGMFPNNATLDHEVRKVLGLEEPAS